MMKSVFLQNSNDQESGEITFGGEKQASNKRTHTNSKRRTNYRNERNIVEEHKRLNVLKSKNSKSSEMLFISTQQTFEPFIDDRYSIKL